MQLFIIIVPTTLLLHSGESIADFLNRKKLRKKMWNIRKAQCVTFEFALYWKNFPQTCYLVTLGTICEEMRNASKNFFALKGAPYMVNLIAT